MSNDDDNLLRFQENRILLLLRANDVLKTEDYLIQQGHKRSFKQLHLSSEHSYQDQAQLSQNCLGRQIGGRKTGESSKNDHSESSCFSTHKRPATHKANESFVQRDQSGYDQIAQIDPTTLANNKAYRQCGNEICKQYAPIALKNFWGRRRRSGGDDGVVGQTYYLCGTCNDSYNKNQFCDFCKQVYFDPDSKITDGKEWVGCDLCNKWNHIDCQVKAAILDHPDIADRL